MHRIHPALILLVVAVLAYGLLIPQLGFYWDDLPMSWIRYELGPEAMTRYFSTNRPVWGLLYQITTRLLPQVPAYWQIFALLWRLCGGSSASFGKTGTFLLSVLHFSFCCIRVSTNSGGRIFIAIFLSSSSSFFFPYC
jgi:hypothetical protein